jgi:putative oxidoreductase
MDHLIFRIGMGHIVGTKQMAPESETSMIDTRTAEYAPLVLRLTTGILFLIHAGLKIFVFTPAGTAAFFASVGLPGWLAYVTMAWEVLGGIALILGVWPRITALLMTGPLLGAILAVHSNAGFFFDSPHGGWEYPAFWIIALISLALIGDGPFALRPSPVATANR